jgi:raffinose/stachyose/melibiose transport system permease protein
VVAQVITRRERAFVARSRGAAGTRVPFWFAVAGLLVYGVIVILPDIAGAVFAFTDWSGVSGKADFVGFDNFVRLFNEPGALGALVNTLIIAVAVTVLQTVIGLLLAIVLNRPMRSGALIRGLFFLPVLLPPVVVAFLWQFLLTPDGPMNEALRAIGLSGLAHNWLADGTTALGSVIVVMVWQNVGITMVIYLAGLQGVPEELLEAAAIDGASRARRFWDVTFPLLAPATTIVVSLTLISGLKVFDQVFAMTGGGPGYATQTISVLMYKSAFVSAEYGYSTAIALVLTALILVLAATQFGVLRRRETAQ